MPRCGSLFDDDEGPLPLPCCCMGPFSIPIAPCVIRIARADRPKRPLTVHPTAVNVRSSCLIGTNPLSHNIPSDKTSLSGGHWGLPTGRALHSSQPVQLRAGDQALDHVAVREAAEPVHVDEVFLLAQGAQRVV